MFPFVETKNPSQVESAVRSIYFSLYPKADPSDVPKWFSWAMNCFEGKHPGYLPIDMKYHDVEHTLLVALCLARLLEGRQLNRTEPPLTQHQFKLALLAVLFHDTGYLKRTDDQDGTGAKYTLIHVDRSAEFAAQFLAGKGFIPKEIMAIQNMIHCTGVSMDLEVIPFHDDLEQILGFALGTADLVGQMADPNYLQKLPVLYLEFEECRQFYNGEVPARLVFASVDDLVQKTPWFWEKYVRPKIHKDFLGLFSFLARPDQAGRNEYIERIEANIAKLRQQLAPA